MAGSAPFAIPMIVFFALVQGRIQSGALAGGATG